MYWNQTPDVYDTMFGTGTVGNDSWLGVKILFCFFFTDRLRRTQSGGLQGGDPDAGQFQRGGLRATAGPRLTRTPESHSSVR